MTGTHEKHGDDAEQQSRPQPAGMLDLEQRAAIQTDVSHGAAAEGSESGDHASPYRIEPLARRFQEARYRKCEYRQGLDGNESIGQAGQ